MSQPAAEVNWQLIEFGERLSTGIASAAANQTVLNSTI